jgi:hypothetical protein
MSAARQARPLSTGDAVLRRAASLLLLFIVAKLTLLALRAGDGHPLPPLDGAGLLSLFGQDLLIAVAFLTLDLQAQRLTAGSPRLARIASRAAWAVYAALVAWTALNVPIARTLGTPLTVSLLGAAGGALSDSILGYLDLPNVLAVSGLLLVSALAPAERSWRLLARPALLSHARTARLIGLGALALATLLVSSATAETDRSGRVHLGSLGDNASWALLRSASQQLQRGRHGTRTSANELTTLTLRKLTLGSAKPARDLSRFRGKARGLNVLWVILESTGARYLRDWQRGADLTKRDPMPNLTRLTRRALRFQNAYAAYPESIKGLWAQLCAASPAPHTKAADYAAAHVPCAGIGAQLRRVGYRTAFFHSGRFVYLGMRHVVRGRGFETLRDAGSIDSPHASSFGVDDNATAGALLRWIGHGGKRRPFFAVYSPIAGHHPYELPGGGPSPFGRATDKERYLSDLYRGDLALGRLLDGLRRRGLLEQTLVIVDGDHGEAFRQHAGNIAHSLHIFEENVHVPLYMVLPARLAPREQLVIPQLASLTDVAPTLLELIGAPLPAAMQGRSLLAPLGPQTSRPVVFFADHARTRLGLRHGSFKLILERESERAMLFDLAQDPDERRDIAARQPLRVRRYRAYLQRWAARQRAWVRSSKR